MASNALLPSNLPPGGNISADIIQQVVDLVKQNITIIGGALSTTAGLAMLLPSLTVVIVNAIGFTAEGVVKASIAASIQSAVYGAWTAGVFSAFQTFGATAVVAPPVALALGEALLVVGGVPLSGIFSMPQSFRATAVVAPPAIALALGGILVGGVPLNL